MRDVAGYARPGRADPAKGRRVDGSDKDSRRWDPAGLVRCLGCCTDIDEVRTVLGIVVHNLPLRD
jgi:hypothetical protein